MDLEMVYTFNAQKRTAADWKTLFEGLIRHLSFKVSYSRRVPCLECLHASGRELLRRSFGCTVARK